MKLQPTNPLNRMQKVQAPKRALAGLKPTKAKKVSKVAKRNMKTGVKRVNTGMKAVNGKITMLPPLAPFSDAETIRTAVAKYKDSFALRDSESPMQGLGQIIKKYGKLPFAFFALSALASKEIYMMDPGVLITFNTSVVIFSYYAMGYEGVKNSYNAFVENINSKYQEGLKTSTEILEAGIAHCQSALDKPGIIAESNVAFQEAHDALTVARVNVSKQKHKDAILSKLNVIVGQEAAEAKQQAEAIRAEAMSFLQANAFSDKVKADVMDEALALVGKNTGTDAQEFKVLQNVLKQSLDHAQKAKK